MTTLRTMGRAAGVGGRRRALDEHEPAERGDRRVSGQDPPASRPSATTRGGVVGRLPARCGAGGLHLIEPRIVALVAKHPAVRMGDQMVPGIHHVGVPVRADLDLRDDLLDGPRLTSAVVTSTAYLPTGTASVTYGSDSFLK